MERRERYLMLAFLPILACQAGYMRCRVNESLNSDAKGMMG